MKLPRFAGFLVITVMLLSSYVFAMDFVDDMAAANSTEAIQYTGLKPYTGNVSQLSDISMLTFTNIASPKGRVTYRVNNPSVVTAGIYTYGGTAVSQGGDGLMMGKGGTQASWSGQANAVYTSIGGLKQLGLSNRTKTFMFLPVVTPPASDVAGYGVNIYYSNDGVSFFRASANLSRYLSEALCYEEYTAYVPNASKYVAVEINDVTSWPLDDGGHYQSDNAARYTRLAMVRISGDGVTMGEPAGEIAAQPASRRESSQARTRDSQETEINLAANEIDSSDKEESVDEKAKGKSSSSKFEGTITSSSKPERSQSPKTAARSAETSSQKDESSQSPSESEQPRDQTIVYELRREEKDGLLESGVTVYIIVVVGTIVLLLLFGRKR